MLSQPCRLLPSRTFPSLSSKPFVTSGGDFSSRPSLEGTSPCRERWLRQLAAAASVGGRPGRVWNKKGDIGTLYDAGGKPVDRVAYGNKVIKDS